MSERDANDVLRDEGPDAVRKWIDEAVPYKSRKTKTGNGSAEKTATTEGVKLDDFRAYMPMHKYIFMPSGEIWPSSSVNARIKPIEIGVDREGKPKFIAASRWLDRNAAVEQMTWSPGEPQVINDRLISEGGWFNREGCAVFNLYRPPTIRPQPGDVSRWLNHAERVFGDNAGHIIAWLAHRVQRPEEKINHALVLGGEQGIGKDTLVEPAKTAVGAWNFQEVSPRQVLGRFNGFLKSVILRVNEGRDLGEFDRFAFYDHMKAYTAAPPDVLRVDEKNLREHAVLNVCGVIITTNHKTDGIYLPADDRRHFVAWSDLQKEEFSASYWKSMYAWLDEGGGREFVADYLNKLDLSGFDPKAPPPKTAAFFEIVNSSRAPEDNEVADALERLGWPEVTTLQHIRDMAEPDFIEWLNDRRNSRRIPHRLESCGYVAVANEGQTDGRWKFHGKNVAVYAKKALPVRDRILAARRFVDERGRPWCP